MRKIKTIILSIMMIATLFGCSLNEGKKYVTGVDTYKEKGVLCYSFNGKTMPVYFGQAKLSKNELDSLLYDSVAKAAITNYADAIEYVKCIDFIVDKKDVIQKVCFYIADDYEEVGRIRVSNNTTPYDYVYIKVDGKYYIDNVFDRLVESDSNWMEEFSCNKLSFKTMDELKDSLLNTFSIFKPTSISNERILDTEKYELCRNEEMICINGYYIPKGLGEPQLKNSELRELIKNKNYIEYKDKINSVADLVRYLSTVNFEFDRIFTNKEAGKYFVIDTGNILEKMNNGDVIYTLSGLESLMINKGQCTSMSTMFNYLLKDNYEEIGYMNITFADEDGHAMIYVKNDGRYYILNPVDYSTQQYNWLSRYSGLGSSDSLEELMNSFVQKYNKGKDVGIARLHTIVSDEPFIRRIKWGNAPVSMANKTKMLTYPLGTVVTGWTDESFDYEEINSPFLDQEYIFGFFN